MLADASRTWVGNSAMNRRLVAIVQTSSMIAAASFAGVLVKLALRDVHPFTFVWLQIAIGGVLLSFHTFVIRRERIPRHLGRNVWLYIVLIGVGNFSIVRLMFMLSLERLPATTNVYLINFVGVVTMLMSIFVLRERPSTYQILGTVVALSGLRVFFEEVPAPTELSGVIFVGIGVLALATTNNVARKLAIVTRNGLSNNMVSTVALWIGGFPIVACGLMLDWPPAVSGSTNWGIVVLSAVVSIAVGHTLWNFILRTLRSYEASLLASSSVIYTALFAIPVLGERLTPHQVIGIVLMFVGLLLVQVRRTSSGRGGRAETDKP
jgi:drug/metabolite transporter (DMT)-like permease